MEGYFVTTLYEMYYSPVNTLYKLPSQKFHVVQAFGKKYHFWYLWKVMLMCVEYFVLN